MKILGIETSCDETAVAIVEGKGGKVREIESLVASQIPVHAKTGGVVPEVAAREHVSAIIPLLRTLLGKWTRRPKLDAIAVTAGPGLFSSLAVGVETAKALAFAWGLPLVRVNHTEGHFYSSFINEKEEIKFPALALIVSGGHTELLYVPKHGNYKLVGRTRDDAAGEAFDKTAQMMKLGYPGGPAISRAALRGNPNAFALPRPMLGENNFDFSFAGLKTAVLYKLKSLPTVTAKTKNDMSASVQAAIVEVLTEKAFRAAKKLKVKTILLGGGVAANAALRTELVARGKNALPDVKIILPQLRYTTDNAVMVAAAGYFHAAKKDFIPWQKIEADPNWELVD